MDSVGNADGFVALVGRCLSRVSGDDGYEVFGLWNFGGGSGEETNWWSFSLGILQNRIFLSKMV